MSVKTDLRVMRTQKAIREYFLKLLKAKRYEQITIQDIATEAIINRNTFYLHYVDKEDLLQKLSNECLNELKSSLSSNINTNELNNDDLYPIIKEVFETIQKNISFYQVMIIDNKIPCFIVKLKEIISSHISGGLEQFKPLNGSDKQQRGIYIEYMVTGFVGVICFWLNSNSIYSIEEISTTLFNIHSLNNLEFLKLK